MTNEELDRLAELERKATAGPWRCDCNQFGTMPTCQPIVRTSNDGDNGVSDRDGIMIVGVGDCGWEDCDGPGFKDADAGLIAALRNAAPALLAAARENARLRALIDEAREVIVAARLFKHLTVTDSPDYDGRMEARTSLFSAIEALDQQTTPTPDPRDAVVEAARKLNAALLRGFDAMNLHDHEACCDAERDTYASQSGLSAALSALDAKGGG